MLMPSNLSPGSRDFLFSVAQHLALHGKRDEVGELLQIDREARISEAIEASYLQDAPLFRARRRAVLLANWIIDEEGNFLSDRLLQCRASLAEKRYIFYAEGRSDYLIQEHIARTLEYFNNEPSLTKLLGRFSRPLCHAYAERLIRLSLFLSPGQVLTHAHVRRAVFSACLTYLRQSIGSCFATAPALLIQTEQIHYLLQDLYEILSTGRMKRILEGEEYSVPLSPSFGMGDLRRDLALFPNKHTLFRSPGLLASCLAAGILSEHLSLQEQEEQLRAWLQRSQERKDLSLIAFFEEVILQVYAVSKEEWQAFVYRRGMPQQRLALQGMTSPRDVLCEKVELALRSFKETFVAFIDHPLLKSWEFTLASFSEGKTEFSRWNLYASLGLNPEEEGGIGQLVMNAVQEKLEEANHKVKQLHEEYEIAFNQVRGTEVLLHQVDSQEKARRLQAEHASRAHHMHSLLEMRNAAHAKGEQYANLLSFLVKQYDVHFPQFFQEIYDAEMFDSKAGPYQDSMAGFRLVYKHGRNDPSQWTMIHDSHQYIESLIDFFKMTETSIMSSYPYQEAAREISHLTDLIIAHIRSPQFLETAMLRMQKAYSPEKLPSYAPDMLVGQKKPWAYISGGTMETLIKFYYRYPGVITAESRWVESAEDLLVLFLDGLKGLSLKNSEHFENNRKAMMFAHSPNHAFVLFPGWPGFFAGWQDTMFTYTWVRDFVVNPARDFYRAQILTAQEQLFLIEEWSRRFSSLIQHQVVKAFSAPLKTRSLHDFVQALVELTRGYVKEDELLAQLDGFFYEMLPLCTGENWKNRVLLAIPESQRDSLLEKLIDEQPDDLYTFLGSLQMQEIAKAFLLLARQSVQTEIDLHRECAVQVRLKKIAPVAPLIFADTNWPHFLFAFMWGPASERFRLWRMDASGLRGHVMSEWEVFLQGKQRLSWGLYPRLEQYM